MDQLKRLMLYAHDYPKNLVSDAACSFDLNDYHQRLDKDASRLFGPNSTASVDFLELENAGEGFCPHEIRDEDELRAQFRWPNGQKARDPLCRYVFLHALSSRDPLKVTRRMLAFLFTYHEVLPIFLDFLFPFGQQTYAKDFYVSGFRRDERFSNPSRINEIEVLGRSGRDYHLCYNLRSIETTKNPPEWPWTIRQTAVYHTFDLETGRSFWTMVKGNKSMRDRIKKATDSSRSNLTTFGTVQAALAASLATHLVLCEWSRDNWARYIGFLEEEFQRKTRHAIATPVKGQPERATAFQLPARSVTMPHITRRDTLTKSEPSRFQKLRRAMTSNAVGVPATAPNPIELNGVVGDFSAQDTVSSNFSFSELQHIQHVEEKSNESLLVIKSNVSIMLELRDYYDDLHQTEHFPAQLKDGAKLETNRFKIRVSSIVNDLKLQQSRLETLLRLLADRKSMLFGILDYKNMQSNKSLTEKAQQSADKMEKITVQMREIALKTEQETVFMRIITVVTLFFLPGTFISTLMSTDILRFEPNRIFSGQALGWYIGITVPVMIITFAASYIFRKAESKKAHQARMIFGHDIEAGM